MTIIQTIGMWLTVIGSVMLVLGAGPPNTEPAAKPVIEVPADRAARVANLLDDLFDAADAFLSDPSSMHARHQLERVLDEVEVASISYASDLLA